ncbi:hypothetical protein MUO98_00745, partial [Candidatus Bathyarchaeota archaeon]|nr:hypothetical protein [Candidatus Bathyarchaeota archaeon]
SDCHPISGHNNLCITLDFKPVEYNLTIRSRTYLIGKEGLVDIGYYGYVYRFLVCDKYTFGIP